MNADEVNVCDFDQLRDFIGTALKAVRDKLKKSKQDLSDSLRLVYGLVQAKETWISLVEDDPKFHLFIEEFEILCRALEVPAKEILDCAWKLKKQSALNK